MKKGWEVIYVKVPLSDIMEEWARGFKVLKGTEVFSSEWYVDPVKGTVVFQLTVKPKGESVT